jgi:NAD(P)H-hydrate epimerase
MNDFRLRLYAAAQVRELDRRAIEVCGIPGYALMQRAARATWCAAQAQWPAVRSLLVLVGPGNNGGDGYEIACLARAAGAAVRVIQVGPAPAHGDAVTARAAWLAHGGVENWAQTGGVLPAADLAVDAIFGTGLSRMLQGEAREAIAAINAVRAGGTPGGTPVLAVDIPSGLHTDTGAVLGEAIQADLTVTFIGRKIGLYTGEGPAHTGRIVFDALEVPAAVYEEPAPAAILLDAAELGALLPPRRRTAHKGDNGHVLVVGGDSGFAGAALMAARAALHGGAGLVSVATRAVHAAILAAAQPEAMFRGTETAAELRALLAHADVVAVGPGLGQGDWAQMVWAEVLAADLPMVVDADALNLLSRSPGQRHNWVLTPHPGECGRLLGSSAAVVQADRIGAARSLQERYGGVAVLKGAGSLVLGEQLRVCPYGNPGMGVGGMGDVLTGIIAALMGQGLSCDSAACAGVMAHALAGDRAARDGERGLLPSDLIGQLRAVVNPAAASPPSA